MEKNNTTNSTHYEIEAETNTGWYYCRSLGKHPTFEKAQKALEKGIPDMKLNAYSDLRVVEVTETRKVIT